MNCELWKIAIGVKPDGDISFHYCLKILVKKQWLFKLR